MLAEFVEQDNVGFDIFVDGEKIVSIPYISPNQFHLLAKFVVDVYKAGRDGDESEFIYTALHEDGTLKKAKRR